MDASAFVSGAGASRWVPTVANPRLIRHQVRKEKEQQLLQEAASLLPDSDGLTKMLLDYKLHPADYDQRYSEVRSTMNEYLQKYHQDPYYAFTKEGRDQTRALQYLVNDPNLKVAEQEASRDNELYKKAQADNNAESYNVVNGTLITGKNGKPLTVRDTLSTVANQLGTLGRERSPFEYTMTNPDEVSKKIEAKFSGLGLTSDEDFAGILSQKTSNNYAQVRAAVNSAKADLSAADRDTIYSQYYQQTGDTNPKNAEAHLDYMIALLGQRSVKTSRDFQVNPSLLAKGEQAKIDASNNADPLTIAIGTHKQMNSFTQIGDSDGNGISFNTTPIVGLTDFSSNSKKISNEKGETVSNKMSNLGDLGVFSSKGADIKGAVMYANGVAIKPTDGSGNSMINDVTAKNIHVREAKYAEVPVDGQGNPISAAQLKKLAGYIKNQTPVTGWSGDMRGFYDPNSNSVRTKGMIQATVSIPETTSSAFFDGLPNDKNKDLAGWMRGQNYASREFSTSETKDYNQNVHDEVTDDGWGNATFFETEMYIPITSLPAARQGMGYDVKIPKEGASLLTMGDVGGNIPLPPINNPAVRQNALSQFNNTKLSNLK